MCILAAPAVLDAGAMAWAGTAKVEMARYLTAKAAQQITMTQIMTAISTAQSVAGLIGQQQAASAQAQYQQQMFDQNRDIAAQAATDQYQGLGTRTSQEREAAALDIMNANRAGREAGATARTSAGEAGISGASVEALGRDFERRQLEYTFGRGRSQDFREADYEARKKGIRNQQQGRVLSMLPKPQEKPNYLGAALRIGAGYLDAKRMFSTPVMGKNGMTYYDNYLS